MKSKIGDDDMSQGKKPQAGEKLIEDEKSETGGVGRFF